jgi:hypothetical protein
LTLVHSLVKWGLGGTEEIGLGIYIRGKKAGLGIENRNYSERDRLVGVS